MGAADLTVKVCVTVKLISDMTPNACPATYYRVYLMGYLTISR